MPLFTIGIASYNYAEYIIKELEAIRKQSFQDYEVLISDDCSTDASVSVIKQYMEEHPKMNIRLLEKKVNEGLVANKNSLIEHCKGEYLMICDADDWMSEDCLAKMAEMIKQEHPDRIIGEVAHVDEKGDIIQVEKLPEHQTKWGWNLHHGSVCRTAILKEHNIHIEGEPDDVYYTLEIAKYCKRVSYIHEILYYWMVHLDSEGRKPVESDIEKPLQRHIDVLDLVQDTIRYVESENNIQSGKDIEELRLVKLKMYYFAILFVAQKFSLRDKYIFYHAMKKEMKSLDKDYMKNQYLYFCREKYLRPYALRAIQICVLLEKLHLMGAALFGYHLLGKVVYFDQ